MVAAATVVLLLGIMGRAAIDETAGWSHAWRAVSARWRLDVGAPARTEPYPGLDSPPLARLVAVGDVGTGGDAEYATAAAVDRLDAGRDLDALLLLGDNVYPDGDPRQVAPRRAPAVRARARRPDPTLGHAWQPRRGDGRRRARDGGARHGRTLVRPADRAGGGDRRRLDPPTTPPSSPGSSAA
jgi:hypothetical protein